MPDRRIPASGGWPIPPGQITAPFWDVLGVLGHEQGFQRNWAGRLSESDANVEIKAIADRFSVPLLPVVVTRIGFSRPPEAFAGAAVIFRLAIGPLILYDAV